MTIEQTYDLCSTIIKKVKPEIEVFAKNTTKLLFERFVELEIDSKPTAKDYLFSKKTWTILDRVKNLIINDLRSNITFYALINSSKYGENNSKKEKGREKDKVQRNNVQLSNDSNTAYDISNAFVENRYIQIEQLAKTIVDTVLNTMVKVNLPLREKDSPSTKASLMIFSRVEDIIECEFSVNLGKSILANALEIKEKRKTYKY